jgi:hypothetical protein
MADMDSDLPAKRIKGNGPGLKGLVNDAIFVSTHDAPTSVRSEVPDAGNMTLPVSKILTPFRLNTKQLGKKDRYQILYFPLTEPLTEQERLACRVVVSDKAK